MGASPPFRTSPEGSVARAKPALGAEHLSGKRLVKDVMRAFSDSPLYSRVPHVRSGRTPSISRPVCS